MSDKKNKPTDIQTELEDRNNSVNTGNELVFDPATGELVVARDREEVSPDAATVSQIADDGFAINKI